MRGREKRLKTKHVYFSNLLIQLIQLQVPIPRVVASGTDGKYKFRFVFHVVARKEDGNSTASKNLTVTDKDALSGWTFLLDGEGTNLDTVV